MLNLCNLGRCECLKVLKGLLYKLNIWEIHVQKASIFIKTRRHFEKKLNKTGTGFSNYC